MGEEAILEFDRDIAISALCDCGCNKEIFTPVHKLVEEDLICPECTKQMTFKSIHSMDGSEEFISKVPSDLGIPKLHIIAGRVGAERKYYEFSKDETILNRK